MVKTLLTEGGYCLTRLCNKRILEKKSFLWEPFSHSPLVRTKPRKATYENYSFDTRDLCVAQLGKCTKLYRHVKWCPGRWWCPARHRLCKPYAQRYKSYSERQLLRADDPLDGRSYSWSGGSGCECGGDLSFGFSRDSDHRRDFRDLSWHCDPGGDWRLYGCPTDR